MWKMVKLEYITKFCQLVTAVVKKWRAKIVLLMCNQSCCNELTNF